MAGRVGMNWSPKLTTSRAYKEEKAYPPLLFNSKAFAIFKNPLHMRIATVNNEANKKYIVYHSCFHHFDSHGTGVQHLHHQHEILPEEFN